MVVSGAVSSGFMPQICSCSPSSKRTTPRADRTGPMPAMRGGGRGGAGSGTGRVPGRARPSEGRRGRSDPTRVPAAARGPPPHPRPRPLQDGSNAGPRIFRPTKRQTRRAGTSQGRRRFSVIRGDAGVAAGAAIGGGACPAPSDRGGKEGRGCPRFRSPVQNTYR